jgi:hypothetical protein
MKIYAGIDNGLLGAIGLVSEEGELLGYVAMPTTNNGKGRDIDIKTVWSYLKPLADENQLVVVLEAAAKHSPGKLALCSTWFSFGHLIALMQLKNLRHEIVPPQKWQKLFWTKPKMPKDQKFNTKAAALMAAKKLWPHESFLASSKSKRPHDGIVDALLIAEAGRRLNL